MNTRSSNQRQFWPSAVLIMLIVVTLTDSVAQFSTVAFPSGVLGAAAVLLVGGVLLFPRFTQRNFTLPLTMLLGLLVSCLAANWMTVEASVSAPSLASIAVALGVSICCVVIAPLVPNSAAVREAPEIAVDRDVAVLFERQSFDSVDISDVENLDLAEGHFDDAESILQSWTRIRAVDGTERMEGLVVLNFQEGERVQHYHIPCFPAFTSIPEGWCECDEGTVRAEFSLLQTYGARLTVRRSLSDLESRQVEVSIVLRAIAKIESAA